VERQGGAVAACDGSSAAISQEGQTATPCDLLVSVGVASRKVMSGRSHTLMKPLVVDLVALAIDQWETLSFRDGWSIRDVAPFAIDLPMTGSI
jgi:hypothetical protein